MAALGINWANLIVQLVAFALFIWLFWRFALGPITSIIDQRRERINDSIAAAEKMQLELAATAARNEEVLAEARREGQTIIARAREVSEQNIARSREQAEAVARDIQAKAHEAVAAEVAQARVELRREVGELAVSAAEKIVRANLDRSAQSRLIDETLADAGRTTLADA